MAADTEGLNEFQQRRLSVSCAYIDKLLSDVEAVLWASSSKSAFPKYIPDIPPGQRRVIEDYISRIRARLVRTLESQGIPIGSPSIPATRSVHTALTFVRIAVEELRPRYMRGYGEVSPVASAELNGIVRELEGLVSQLDRFVWLGAGTDLQHRLQTLEGAGAELSLLKALERVITERGLVEFRSTLTMILERLEDKSFEIAVFGRVSSGKSSLLNHVLETDVLPVGVTPITAVPTRILFGNSPEIQIYYAESRPPETFEISRLAHFVTEQRNPGNAKHVSRVLVRVPSAGLREGIVFVDTPGLGSLATSGAAETMAYLPRCDLGVVLIDAASALTPDDLQTIQSLYRAGVPANVLLSKVDLLSEEDRRNVMAYVAQHIRSELGVDLKVHPISIRPGYESLLQDWFRLDIALLFDNRQELKQRSLQRKIGMLRESVMASLQMRLNRAQPASTELQSDLHVLDAKLRQASAKIEETANRAREIIEELSTAGGPALQVAARELVKHWESHEKDKNSATIVADVLQHFVHRRAAVVQESLSALASHLSEALNYTGAQLQLADTPQTGEFEAFMRGMPSFESSGFAVQVSRPTLSALLGNHFAETSVQHELRKLVGAKLSEALDTYSRLLSSWGESIIAQLQHRFDAYAAAYRAQLDRTFAGGEASMEERKAIEADLRSLGVTVVNHPVVQV